MEFIKCKCGCGELVPQKDKKGRLRFWRPGHSNMVKPTESEDMVSKGRSAKGERHHNSKLTESSVSAIRSLHESGRSYSWLASEFHVSKFAIACIIKRQTWRHVQ